MKRYYRVFLLIITDVFSIIISGTAVFAAFKWYSVSAAMMLLEPSAEEFAAFSFITLAVYCCVLIICGVYHIVWRYPRMRDFFMIFVSCFAAGAVLLIINDFILKELLPPIHILVHTMFTSYLILSSRILYLMVLRGRGMKQAASNTPHDRVKNVMVVGAGTAGSLVLREITGGHPYYSIKAVVDDDPHKLGRAVYGCSVLGDTGKIEALSKCLNIDVIFFAIPSADPESRRRILTICKNTGCNVKVVPYVHEAIFEHDTLKLYKDLDIEELLGRSPVSVLTDKNRKFIAGKVCIVTGGGGSIGSELCRQIILCGPKLLVIFDNYENNAYAIEQELIDKYGFDVPIAVQIGSVQDKAKVQAVFEKFKPDLVFHAAAHKHVPLMEVNPEEAVKNNVFGTFNVAETAVSCGVKRFVLVSTDKAVNPTNFMGATKRICEMIVQYFHQIQDKTEFVAVRFGNVLGSNGSVIPRFVQQIKENRAVNVTHEEMTRFFMTIPEAVSLIMKAGAIANGGEIFVLDMGEPVKILNLAEDVIRLSGLEPYVDVRIDITGLRPGEKMYEEILMNEEGLVKTEDEKIFIGRQIDIIPGLFLGQLEALRAVAFENSFKSVEENMLEIVPTFIRNKG